MASQKNTHYRLFDYLSKAYMGFWSVENSSKSKTLSLFSNKHRNKSVFGSALNNCSQKSIQFDERICRAKFDHEKEMENTNGKVPKKE